MIGTQIHHRDLAAPVKGRSSRLALRLDGSRGENSCGPIGDDNSGHSSSDSRVRIPTAERARVPQHCSSTEG